MVDGSHHRRKNNTALKVGTVVLGVLVLLGAVQAVTAGTIGVGALSVTLRQTTSAAAPSTTRPATTDDTAGLDGAVGAAESSPSPEAPAAGVEDRTAEGSWQQARGLLTVEVTKVENRGGALRVFVTAVNASTAKMDLPVASVAVVDDTGRDYGASLSTSKWPGTVAKNSSVNGYLDLDRKVPGAAGAFSLTFAGIVGQLAPTGGSVTVPGIPVPR
ncbi:hypothetical protein ACFFSW_21105 [Saccharothrix longispora]|uniref:DUF4352 domain-containing protein n=1 Tax=Saccharothrix longispora TaxID=33920 RepID=A0ABU1Q638_9PSEU|nr:hypothetical protein [Saccharothrix longispora]MDR6598339.1 hypothetical protein [Saccharothrix longispora]